MSADKLNDDQIYFDDEPSDSERLTDMTLERDFFAERLEDVTDQLAAFILDMSHDQPRRERLLRIFFAADEAKCNAFWLVNFAGKN